MNKTWQDYEKSSDKVKFIADTISEYEKTRDFKIAKDAYRYFNGNNTHIMELKPLVVNLDGVGSQSIEFTKIPSNIFKRLILQLVNFQLSEGVSVNEKPIEDFLGIKANRQLMELAKNALIGGVAYSVVNNNQIQAIYTAKEMFVLRDEWDSSINLAVRFWHTKSKDKDVLFFQIFERDGFTVYRKEDNQIQEYKPKTAYTKIIRKDGLGEEVVGTQETLHIPIVPMYANDSHHSELTPNIKSKIDMLDEIVSRNATFVSKTSMIYWVLNSTFNGDAEVINQTLKTLEGLGIAVVGQEERAEPTTVDPNVAPRLETKSDLENDIYKDFMGLNMEALTKSTLTATAITASSAMLKMRANDLYFCVRDYIESAMEIIGQTVENVTMKQAVLTNEFERVQMISLARADLTTQKALELNPLIEPEEVPQLLIDLDAENMTGSNGGDE